MLNGACGVQEAGGRGRGWVLLAAALLLTTALAAQTVTGTIRDESGELLIGANVLVAGSSTGTVTDVDGYFELRAEPTDTLVASYIGYARQRVALEGRTSVDIVLGEDADLLQEVVVVGYGVQQKSDVTGSVSTVEADEITRIATPDVASALQGKVAGVQVVPVSGSPGTGSVVRIRGIGTFGDSRPLYVVDGMLTDDIGFLNPNDIERIDVLKDASATAIYGSRGANGVILVTTRRGKAGGGAVVNVDVYRGQQRLERKLDLANATEFATLANQLAVNEGRTTLPYPRVAANPDTMLATTDWQDAIFRDAPIASYQVSASGANEQGSYLVSANHFAQDGIVRGGSFDRTTARFNGEFKIKPRVTVGQNLAFSLRRSVNGPGILEGAYRGYPTIPLRDSAGNFSNTAPVGNVLAQLEYQNSTAQSTRILGNVYVAYEPIEGLRLRSSFGLDRTDGQSRSFTPAFFVSPLQQNELNNLSKRRDFNRTWLLENTVTYDLSFGESRLGLLAGVTAQDESAEFIAGSAQALAAENDEFLFLSNGVDSLATNADGGGSSSIASYLARANYAFGNRYLLTVSMRVDGSSKFGRNNRYGYFPSAALGWRVDQEPFYPEDFVVNRLKARLGYGSVGNDKIGRYASIPLVSSNDFTNAVFGTGEAINFGAAPLTAPNPDLKWETTTSFNAGLEFGAFEDKLSAEVDYYVKTTEDILLVVPVPDYVGVDPPVVNAATIENSGVELLLTWRDRVGRFGYSVSVNGATVNNEVLALGRGQEAIFGANVGSGRNASRSLVGAPVGAFYGLIAEGVIQNEEQLASLPTREGQVVGDVLFRDVNGDGVITLDGDRTQIGSPIPDVTFGATLGAEAYGFDLAVDFSGQAGNEIYNQKVTERFNTYNFERRFLGAFTGEGTSDSEPRLLNGGGNYEVSTRFLEKGDYLRLRNVTLGYTLPADVAERVRLQRLRVYASGTNLVLWDSYSGYSPEVINGNPINNGIDRGVYPVPRTVNVGLQVAF